MMYRDRTSTLHGRPDIVLYVRCCNGRKAADREFYCGTLCAKAKPSLVNS
jgi:hypothetical protein